MEELVSAVIRGMTFGSVYALLAVGLVLTYKTSGVFNLAFGAQAFLSAAVFYELRVRHEWPIPLAFVVAVLIVAPLGGLVLDRLLFRHLRTAPALAKLVTVLGLVVAVPEMVKLAFDEGTAFGGTGLAPSGDTVYRPWGEVYLNRDDIATVGALCLAVVVLVLLFRFTPVGLRMRAVVESPRLTELAGINADRVSMGSWMLSSFMAGLAGVLLPPLFAGQVQSTRYLTLVIAAIAAAVLGGLTSIPLAVVGGLGLGVLQQILSIYLPTNSVLATNLRPSLPFVALFVVLILSPRLRNRREVTDPLSGVDPPPPALAALERSDTLTHLTHALGVLFVGGVLYYLLFHANEKWVYLGTRSVIYAVIFLSITVITGMAGEISLSQAAFAGIGAFATGQLATNLGVSVLIAMLIGGALSALIGALLAIPALRLGGIFLALATFAFALFFENVMVKFTWVSGGILPVDVPRPAPLSVPVVGWELDFTDNGTFLLLCVAILAIMSVLVIWVREGTTGRFLDAMRGSEVAAASVGINPTKARILAFALAAGIAGMGGGLLGMQIGRADYQSNFVAQLGLFWVVIVVSLGARTVEGAIQAALGFIFFPELVLKTWIPWLVTFVASHTFWPDYTMAALPAGLTFVFFGFGAITYARHPEGVLEHQKRRSLARVQRVLDRRRGKTDTSLEGELQTAVAEGSA